MPANELKPCPFCGAGETFVAPNQNWTGMRYAIHSYTLRHICADRTVITMTRNTEALLVAAWNQRAEAQEAETATCPGCGRRGESNQKDGGFYCYGSDRCCP